MPERSAGVIGLTEIRVKGEDVLVPSVQIDGRTVITTGNWLKIAVLHDEELLEGASVSSPESFVAQLKGSGLRADVFSFRQTLSDSIPRYNYHLEWDSFAVIPITTYMDWSQRLAKSDVGRAVKKAARLGLVTKEVSFDNQLVEGIVQIYNECAFRQGKPFWHYGKDFETVKRMSRTYLDRSIFIGTYYKNDLVGFIKMVTVGQAAHTLHVISMARHFDKKPTNALIAKAVEICEQRGIRHLVYGNFRYGDVNSSLTEFKRRNGFREFRVPRYYVPISGIGAIMLRAKLHHGIRQVLPHSLWEALLRGRASLYKLRAMKAT
jgi:hypothetical protein